MAVDFDLVRILIGDTDDSTQLLDDVQLAAVCASFSSSTLAAAACADAIAGKFSRSVTFSVEGLRIDNTAKAEAYLKLAQRLRVRAANDDEGALGVPRIPGTSLGEMAAADADTDRNEGRFKVGREDFPGTEPADVIDQG